MWKKNLSQFCGLVFGFLFFWHFPFNFVHLYLSKNSRNFYAFLFYGLEILSKNLGKSCENIFGWVQEGGELNFKIFLSI